MSRHCIQFVGGWAYSAEALQALAAELSGKTDFAAYPFTADPQEIVANRCILAGWSLGAVKVMMAFPSLRGNIAGMILIGGTARFCKCEGYEHGTDRAVLKSMQTGLRRDRDKTLATFYQLAALPAGEATGAACAFTDDELQEGLKTLDRTDVREIVETIDVPVLLLHGQHDRIVPSSASQYLSEHLPNAEIHVHPDAGHELPLRETDWVVEKINSFLSKLQPTA